MDGAFRRDDTAGKAVSEDLAPAGGAAAGESLEDDVVAALSVGSAVPGAVEGDEEAVVIGGRELLLIIEGPCRWVPSARERLRRGLSWWSRRRAFGHRRRIQGRGRGA